VLDKERLSHNEQSYRLDMSSRRYYRLRQQAITILSIRLWAAPDTEMDVCMKICEELRYNFDVGRVRQIGICRNFISIDINK